jgi:hypothetical protein
MLFRKSFLPLLFAGLFSLCAQEAMAQVPPWDLGGFDWSWGGPWGSTISCTKPEIGGNAMNSVDFTKVEQTADVECVITRNDNTTTAPAICKLHITYERTIGGLTTNPAEQCLANVDGMGTSTLTNEAFCGNVSKGLVVSGTLNCNPQNLSTPPEICETTPHGTLKNKPCIAQLDGIKDVPNGKCKDVFPEDPATGLAAGQVLSAKLISTGSICKGEVVDVSEIITRFCPSGSFKATDPARCVTGSQKFAITGSTAPLLPVEVEIAPETVNVSCSPNKDNGDVRFTIFGSESVNVTLIDPDSLALEGVGVSSCDPPRLVDKDKFLDLQCAVPSCPSLGNVLNEKRKAAGTKIIEVTVTGLLLPGGLSTEGLPIQGADTVKTSP